MSWELYVELIAQTVVEVTSGVVGPFAEGQNPNGRRTLLSDCTIYGREVEPESSKVVDDLASALSAMGVANKSAGYANDFYGGATQAMGVPQNPALKTAGRFLPAAGFTLDYIDEIQSGYSPGAAAAISGGGAIGGIAGGYAGAAVGGALVASLGCGPAALGCAAIVGTFAVFGGIAGSAGGAELTRWGWSRGVGKLSTDGEGCVLMWLVAMFFAVAAATGWYMVREYWRQSDKFFQQRETFRLVFQSRWLSESFMRTPLVVAVTCTLMAVSTLGFAISGSPETASGGMEVLLWLLFVLFFAGCFITIVFAPLIIFFNKPSLMVAPHDRGKPGGLKLKRLYRE